MREFKISLSETCQTRVEEAYRDARLIVEYGSGGSTLRAVEMGKMIITVETDKVWLEDLMRTFNEKSFEGSVIPIWANVGPTREWGHPNDDSRVRKWPKYAVRPWRYCRRHNLQPDVVMIDGRFRVASFLATCAYIEKSTCVLFDDYVKRPRYHKVESLLGPAEIVDDRMAIFHLEPGLIDAQFLLDHIEFFVNPN